jgi:hypothetical protein
MKYIGLALLLFLSLSFIMCTEEGESKVKSYKRTDVSDFHMYKGSPSGAEEITFAHDTIRNNQASIYFRGQYAVAGSIYIDESFEFHEGKATCVFRDSVTNQTKTIVADYEFRNDSLYVHKSEGTWYPIAPGNIDSLYQTMALSRYANEDKTDYIVQRKNKHLTNLDEVLKEAGYADRNAMTDPTDTIMWCNVKYIYK